MENTLSFLCMRSLFGGRIETRWWIAFTLFQFLFGQLMFRHILRDGIELYKHTCTYYD